MRTCSPGLFRGFGDSGNRIPHHLIITNPVSPFGGRIAHPTMVHMDFHRLEDHFLTSRPEEAKVHIEYDARYINPARIGEKITVKSRCAANLIKRGRRYITIEIETFGEDSRPITHYFDTHTISFKREEK